MGSLKMIKSMSILFIVIFMVGLVSASSSSSNNAISSIQINDLIQTEEGFSSSPAEWSPDGRYLLVRSHKSISMFEGINKHYLIDIENRAFGEIDYGITEKESNYLSPFIGWIPSGAKIYFSVSKWGQGKGTGGSNYIICDPDGTDMRVIGSQNKTTLDKAINNLGGGVRYRDLTFSPDSTKVAFEYEDPDNFLGNLWIENIDGTNSFELRAKARKLVWYNSTTVFFLTRDGSLLVTDDRGNSVQAFISDSDGEKHGIVSFSPDKQKMTFPIYSVDDKYHHYISNINGSTLTKTYVGSWQPNGSAMLINKNRSLYILEGNDHSKRLLYEGNATEPRWFPDGTKILFLENENKIYSIDTDGTNISFIADIGLTTHHIWDTYEWEQISISPTGERIAFTSALYQNGDLIDMEPSLKKAKHVAAPLFIINSDGTNLTQLTPSLRGRHDFLDGWSPDGNILTVDFIHFSENGNMHGSPHLISLNDQDIANGWEEMAVSQIIGNDNPTKINNEKDLNETPVLNDSLANGTENKQSPSFRLFQFVFCLMGAWMLQKKRFFYDK
ncbi:TolB family protein [Methanococcoides sp.]|jgi:Tol biopolymer transport system component|uniref:TolB family protein n=1 Tax=Methanococcoides sp. TaxID=1966350 RepID=UPI00272E8678|nr:Tol biopolymer transporter [Methanococcoides sp.]